MSKKKNRIAMTYRPLSPSKARKNLTNIFHDFARLINNNNGLPRTAKKTGFFQDVTILRIMPSECISLKILK